MKRTYITNACKEIAICLVLGMTAGHAMAQAPANDDCSGAISVTASANPTCSNPVSGSGQNATMSSTIPSCNQGSAAADLWYSFTATAAFHRVDLSNVVATNPDAQIYGFTAAAYSGSCGALTGIACSSAFGSAGAPADMGLVLSGLTIGQTYYVQVSADASFDTSFNSVNTAISFDLCITSPSQPANDECSGAVVVTGTGAVVNGNNVNATQSMAGSTCTAGSNSIANDVWYSFTADATGNITITIDQTNIAAVAEVFSGACGSLSSIDCSDTGTITFAATANATYYMRVYGSGATEGIFDLTFSGVPLPVTGGKLKGAVKHGRAELAWSTFSEQHNRGFTVQRSANGKAFRDIAWVGSKAANGNSKNTLHYAFTDQQAIQGTVYYRLQQTDIDGKTTWSSVLPLSAGEDAAFAVVAAPNPVKNKVALTILGTQSGNAAVAVTDITGKLVLQSMPLTGAVTELDMSALPQGLYLVRYHDDKHRQTIKVSKQ